MRPAYALIASAVLVCAAGLALAGEGPMRRPGLWEMKMVSEGEREHNFAMQMCVDPSSEQSHGVFSGPMSGRGAEHENCSVREFHPIPGGMSFHSVCVSNGATVATDGQSTGDYQSHYHVEVTTRRTPGGVRHMVMDGRWLGPCAPGQSGGDMSMVLPNGQVMHMGPGMRPGG